MKGLFTGKKEIVKEVGMAGLSWAQRTQPTEWRSIVAAVE